MNKQKSILHAPDIEDTPYFEEDYLDEDVRRDYEKDIGQAVKSHMPYGHKEDTLTEEEKIMKEKQTEEKVNEIVNYATILL
jgi:hypothetical protein